jgi:hypothetical protein
MSCFEYIKFITEDTIFCIIGCFCEYRNSQKVQLNTDSLKPRHEYLYKKIVVELRLNEIKSTIKNGEFNKEG